MIPFVSTKEGHRAALLTPLVSPVNEQGAACWIDLCGWFCVGYYWEGGCETLGEKLLDSFFWKDVHRYLIRKTDVHRRKHAILSRFPIKKTPNSNSRSKHTCNQNLHLLWQIPVGIHRLNWPVERSKSFCISQTANRSVEGSKFVPAWVSSFPHQIYKWKTPTPRSSILWWRNGKTDPLLSFLLLTHWCGN